MLSSGQALSLPCGGGRGQAHPHGVNSRDYLAEPRLGKAGKAPHDRPCAGDWDPEVGLFLVSSAFM